MNEFTDPTHACLIKGLISQRELKVGDRVWCAINKGIGVVIGHKSSTLITVRFEECKICEIEIRWLNRLYSLSEILILMKSNDLFDDAMKHLPSLKFMAVGQPVGIEDILSDMASLDANYAAELLALTMLKKEEKMEICICAGIKDTTGYIWRGHRHADCISSAIEAGRSIPHTGEKDWQGFVTSKNRFVNRYEGMKLQLAAKIESADRGGYRGNRLFSEDLY